jgi:glycosyltransferase involved in cell wall biosynthesis
MIGRKGVHTAIKTCRAIGAKLKLAGQNSLKISYDKAEFLGYVDVEQRKPLMAKAKAVFVPSIYLEPFAGTHIEAMLSGTPVITTNFGVFPSTFTHGVHGFKCNTLQDFVDAAKKVGELDPKAIRKFAERYLMDNVKLEFEKWFQDLYNLYESARDPKVKGWHRIEEKS